MDKMRRLLYIPVAYHFALFMGMVITQALKINVSLLVLMDWCGVVVSPMLLSVLSIAHAIVHEGKVFDYFKDSVIYLAIISIVRIVLYTVFSGTLLPMGALCALVSLAIFFIWDAIFAFTDKMMKKRPGKGR